MKLNGTEQGAPMARPLFSTKTLAALGVLLAMNVVLTRFLSFNAWNVRIGFGFVPVVLAALFFGPLPAAAIASLGDFLGALLFPTGPYFPGFTLTAFLTGLTFGLLLRRGRRAACTVAAVGIVQLALGLLLNTFWIHILYHSAFMPLLAARAPQAALLSVTQIAVIRALLPLGERLKPPAAK